MKTTNTDYFEEELELIQKVFSGTTKERNDACSNLIISKFKNYKKGLSQSQETALINTLKYAKSDIYTYKIFCILEIKGYTFKNMSELIRFCDDRNYRKCLSFLKYKSIFFYNILKNISPSTIKNVFEGDEILTFFNKQIKTVGLPKLEEKFKEIKNYLLIDKQETIKNFSIEDVDNFLYYEDNCIDNLILLFEENYEILIKYFVKNKFSYKLCSIIEGFLQDKGYNKNISFTEKAPDNKTQRLISCLSMVQSDLVIKNKPYLYNFFKFIESITKLHKIKDKVFELLISKDYIKLRKEIDLNPKNITVIKDNLDFIMGNIVKKTDVLFVKFMLNRGIITTIDIEDNFFKIKDATLKSELISHLNKINLKKDINIVQINKNKNTYYVYFFYEDNKLLYIGKTYNLKSRFYQHKKNSNISKTVIDSINKVYYIEFDTENEASIYEIYYIDKLNPTHNTEFNKSKGLSFILPDKIKIKYNKW